MYNFYVIKIFFFTTIAFLLAMLLTPILMRLLNKFKLGKKIRDHATAPIYSKMHASKNGTPVMGGILIWGTVLILALSFFYLAKFTSIEFFDKYNFLTRAQTLLPLGALLVSAAIGLIDDYLNTRQIGSNGGGMRASHRLIIYTMLATFVAIIGASWFYLKLNWDLIRIPFVGNFEIGLWSIPLFILVIVATAFSVNEIDGLDGLAGGILMAMFGAYSAIAFAQGKYDLASFCGVIVGALLAFLWFNINPAKFFMGDTGAMSLGVTIAIVAMLTNTIMLLPIIGFLLVITSGSVIVQVISKKIRGKKIFLSSPLHHHLEAKGWKEATIVMRFWVISMISTVIGLIIALIDKGWR
ncbi:phospho-N-acetylmuramoyl-pentapeptide-transferase [Candidatus Falkowbacteria bacterium RBG_13_39_14]|uniref:Phospho-N-acetylmuramoyl-pentapeptide-transferase n=1 Tax=Candidatus Falkowbacteria bacterium RBG_13_39_14 TaxID=1797985 RepID=A0A1F5S744_9BACT|nr:MAG: phospho-N-acetylmuramoyl-pentapeptide-transferase [Candidatus Falkowbacteria bacterium RBG_13_39_14]